MFIDIIAGARPNFVKIAPLIRAIRDRAAQGGKLRYRLVHTGQHYDAMMSSVFFDQLGIPSPDVNLGVGSGTQAEQTAAIMIGYESLLRKEPASLCLVVGDVTSTMACAITAKKLGIRVAHVEAGIRSGDLTMPEEINRIVTDSITDWFFTTSEVANAHLHYLGIKDERIFFVGNTMIDTLLENMSRLEKPSFVDEFGFVPKGYLILTLHRPSNVDQPHRLADLLAAISDCARGLPVIFPAHPRTISRLKDIIKLPPSIHLIGPQPYLQFNWLVGNALGVITDSGGITEETTILGVPCMTLRNSTERPETVTLGTNKLLGTDPSALKPAFDDLFSGRWKKGKAPPLWDGQAAPRIIKALETLLAA